MPIFSAGALAMAGISAAGSAYNSSQQRKIASEANNQASANTYDSYHYNRMLAESQRDWEQGQAANAMQFESGQAERMMGFQDASNAKQMQFQERMSSTAHQREIADLRAAGLNPILSGTGGMGSSTPTGASSAGSMARGQKGSSGIPQVSAAQTFKRELVDIIGPAIASAVSYTRTEADVGKTRQDMLESQSRTPIYGEQIKQINATTDNVLADTKFKEAMTGKTEAEVTKIQMETKRVIEQIYETYWSGLSNREDVFNKRTQGRIAGVEARTMEGLEDKELTQILKAHPLIQDFGGLIKNALPGGIFRRGR